MEKDGDTGEAVYANFFPAVLIFRFCTQFFAQVCAFFHNFVVFLCIFAKIAIFLHIFEFFC